MAKDTVVDIEGRHLKLSNLDKVLYPEAGFTKGQVIDYYVRIAPVPTAAPARPAAHHEALSQRREWHVLLREELPDAPPGLGEDDARLERRQQSLDGLLPDRRSADAGVGRQSGRPRAAYQPVAGKECPAAVVPGVRSRSRRARQHRAVLPGWVVGAGDLQPTEAGEFRQDVRLEGTADLRPAQHHGQL